MNRCAADDEAVALGGPDLDGLDQGPHPNPSPNAGGGAYADGGGGQGGANTVALGGFSGGEAAGECHLAQRDVVAGPGWEDAERIDVDQADAVAPTEPRYIDDVGAWQTVEPSLDFTSTALLAFALTAG